MLGRRRWKFAVVLAIAVTGTLVASTTASSNPSRLLPPSHARYAAAHAGQLRANGVGGGKDGGEIADRAAEYANQRIAPGTTLPPEAVAAARAEAARLPLRAGQWREVTTQPYEGEPAGYTDPNLSNIGTGFDLVAGRMTALAVDGPVTYAGAADGGVWRTTDNGAHWVPSNQGVGSESIGALLVDREHRLWVGTGEANTNSDSYQGQGVYVSDDGGASFQRVGGTELAGAQVYQLVQNENGTVFAATTHGLWRHSEDVVGQQEGGNVWQQVFAPDPNPTNSPYRTSFATGVQVRPGTQGNVVLTAIGWRGGTSAADLAYNGLYMSTAGGAPGSFTKIKPTGDLDASDMGRTTLQWSADGQRLWAIVESPKLLAQNADTVLQGVFLSRNGDPNGPWKRVADSKSLGASGSALADLPGYHVGVQAWYNQALTVDPANHDHVYLALEEVFETTDGGTTFSTAAAYWNLGLSCGASCPKTTHPDQHALAISGGKVWSANDGGVWFRPLSTHGLGSWTDTNATLHTLQYYGAGTGKLPDGQLAYWGGLQDNGTSVLNGAHAKTMIEPAGGDGGMMLVDPANGAHSVGEYVYLNLYLTTDGGHNFRTISPVCGGNPDDPNPMPGCDPTARFIAPFVADVSDPNHWVAGGHYVWDDHAAWNTRCHSDGCDWKNVHDLGVTPAGSMRVTTALGVNGATTYAGWVAGGGNPGPKFASGIDTNYGGKWHTVSAPNLPQRYLSSLRVDPTDAGHVYAVYSGYSRHWIPGGGVGHVFESRDGGATWKDISGNLPDVAADDLLIVHDSLIVATDAGVFIADTDEPTRWSRFGANLPGSVVNHLSVTPDGESVVAATHGRGLWQVRVP